MVPILCTLKAFITLSPMQSHIDYSPVSNDKDNEMPSKNVGVTILYTQNMHLAPATFKPP